MSQNKLPNATAVLVLGIISIISCCCYGIGLVPGIVGMVLASKDQKEYLANPELYSNYSNLKIGRILCIIGIVISGLYLCLMLYMWFVLGEDGMRELQMRLEEMQRANQ